MNKLVGIAFWVTFIWFLFLATGAEKDTFTNGVVDVIKTIGNFIISIIDKL